jgi:thioesterase domain-containing protein
MSGPVVFFFPGLTSDPAELAALFAGCRHSLCAVPIGYPHWTEIHRDALRLDDFVAYCQEQIEAHPSAGPKFLAGYSFGGHIAFAVAAALESSGVTIGRLGLLDTAAIPRFEQPARSLLRRLRGLAKVLRRHETDARIGHIIAGLMRRSRYEWPLRLAARLRHVRLPHRMDRHIDVALQMHFNFEILLELLDRLSRPSPPCGFPAVLFRCISHAPEETEDLGWSRHLPQVRIVPVLGNHLSLMIPPNIASFSQAFACAMTDRSGASRGQAEMTS